MAFKSGELDQVILIQREVLASDGMGGQTVSLTNVAVDLPAKARALTGKEFARYDQLNASAMTVFVIRYRDDLREDDRITWNGEAYNIRYIPPISARELYRTIEAEKGVAL